MKILNYALCLGVIAFTSCTNENVVTRDIGGGDLMFVELTTKEALSITPNVSTDLSDEEVIQTVEKFTSSEAAMIGAATSPTIINTYKTSLDNTHTRSDAKGDSDSISFSVVSLDENRDAGFAVVCRDSRYPEVLAYVPNINYEENKSFEPLKLMLARSQNIALGYISKKNAICEQLREATLVKVCNRFEIKKENFDFDKYRKRIVIRDSIEDSRSSESAPSGTLLSQVGPLCGTTRIIQGWPCNQYVPTTSLDKYSTPQHNGHYPAGCVNVALATICSYIQPTIYCASLGRNINWENVVNTHFNPYGFIESEYSEKTDQAIEVANLLKIIADGTSTSFNENGGTTNTSKAASYMQKIGINMDSSTSTLNYANVRTSLSNLALVYCTGTITTTRSENSENGHAWVIDGLQIRKPLSRMEVQNYNCYASCKFGWIESDYSTIYNGWYLFDTTGTISFDFDQESLSSDLYCIPNIKLK